MSDTKILFQSQYFRVLEIEVERKGKKFTKDLIERNSSVYILPLTDNHEIYMEKQYRDAFGTELLEIVAGTIENDADPLETAKRELKEETGLTATNWKLICSCELSVNMRSKGYFFVATGLTEGDSHLDDDEILMVFKIPFTELVEKVMKGEIKAASHIAAILMVDKMMKEGKL